MDQEYTLHQAGAGFALILVTIAEVLKLGVRKWLLPNRGAYRSVSHQEEVDLYLIAAAHLFSTHSNFQRQFFRQSACEKASRVRKLPAAYDKTDMISASCLKPNFFRPQVPLPEGLSVSHLEAAANLTQSMVHRINRNLKLEIGQPLQSLLQGNNFSGLVSNLFSNALDQCSPYKHNHDQKYPDLIFKGSNKKSAVGLEVKTTVNIGKGGESHNRHSGWHGIACYNFVGRGDIQFVHIMFSQINGPSA